MLTEWNALLDPPFKLSRGYSVGPTEVMAGQILKPFISRDLNFSCPRQCDNDGAEAMENLITRGRRPDR